MTTLQMTFDLNTIDHLGVKLYRSFPPVIAELVSNSYDAEAKNVKVSIDYENKVVTVTDDGHGMSFEEINENFLVIGRNRRASTENGLSKNGLRKVTGKKGLGKLAVFGVADEIIITSVSNGTKNAFSMNYNSIKSTQSDNNSNSVYSPIVISDREEVSQENGTSIKLTNIKNETITSLQILAESLSSRFQIFDENFKVVLENLNTSDTILVENEAFHKRIEIEYEWKFPEDFHENMHSDVDFIWLNEKNVTGHIITKSTPLVQAHTGIIIYARKKLIQERTFFNERSNDLFNTYVTGSFTADFLDESNKEDLVSTDRKSLLWDSNEDTTRLKSALDKVLKVVAKDWRSKRVSKKSNDINEILPPDFYDGMNAADKGILENVKKQLAINLPGETDIPKIAGLLKNFKQQFQFETFKDYVTDLHEEQITVENMERISSDWELIETNEMAKIALGRTETIKKFEDFINENSSETKVIQPFLEKFPWILEPRMTVFDREVTFSRLLKENFPNEKLEEPNKRIDFLCSNINGDVIIIELKRPKIKITVAEITQALEYGVFLKKKRQNLNSVKTILISDRFDMDDLAKSMYEAMEMKGDFLIRSYTELIDQAKNYHRHFIELQEKINEAKSE